MLTDLRIKLDEAITYGDSLAAENIAVRALKEAQLKKLAGEIEYFKGQLAILNEDYQSAIKHFDLAIGFNPLDGASFNDRALCMVELGEIDAAFKYFDQGIEVEPDFATIHHNKGWLLNKLGSFSAAIDCFKTALELDNKRSVTYENMGNAYLNLGEYKKALQAYRKALVYLKKGHSHIRKQIESEIRLLELEVSLKQ
jgi:tetratricopeptide (TPR) repeat protein